MKNLTLAAAGCGLLLAVQAVLAAEVPDLSKLVRPPRKEPAYLSKRPLYGLAAFGPRAQKGVWLVLDKSKAEGSRYDVLYIDINADGDLTSAGERLTVGSDGRFRLDELTDPATGVKHKEFTLRVNADNEEVMLSVRWRGQFRFGGGYPEDPETGYLHFAQRPADAPVLWVHGDGPFRFQRWYGGKLTIGGSDDFKVFLGQPGRGKNAFCAAQQHFLPAKEWVNATLIYRDGMGKEKRLACELKERC